MNKTLILSTALITAILIAVSQRSYSQENLNENLKKNLMGKWQMNSDKNYFIILSNDKIKSMYKGKVKSENIVTYEFNNTNKFYKGKNTFDFTDEYSIHNDCRIVEYQKDGQSIDTLYNYLIFIDGNNLELNSDGIRVSFKKFRNFSISKQRKKPCSPKSPR